MFSISMPNWRRSGFEEKSAVLKWIIVKKWHNLVTLPHFLIHFRANYFPHFDLKSAAMRMQIALEADPALFGRLIALLVDRMHSPDCK